MYTSIRRTWLRHALIQMAVTIFFALFGAVYEYFSHEVYSYYMIYSFAVPLLFGVLPYSLMAYKPIFRYIKPSVMCWNAGIITVTIGCTFNGVLEIYGTTNHLILVYHALGALFIAASVIIYIVLRHSIKGESEDAVITG